MAGTQQSLVNAAFSAVSHNEVSGVASTANRLSSPITGGAGGSSGWTIGWDQEDFNTNGTIASTTLTNALLASGQFSRSAAANIATALEQAGTSSTLNLSGITDLKGNAATLATIDAALATSAASSSIYASSQNSFANTFNNLSSSVFAAPGLTAAVTTALADPTYGPLLKIALADFANQYGGISASGPMMSLLQTGVGQFPLGNGTFATVNLNTASPASVTQSVMDASLSTKWVLQGTNNGSVACNRLAQDVAAATAYDVAAGVAAPGNQALSSQFGSCTITQSGNTTSFTGSWASGSANTNGNASANGPWLDTWTNDNLADYFLGVSGGTIDILKSIVNGNTTSQACTINGNGISTSISNATISLGDASSATLTGAGDTVTLGNGGTAWIYGFGKTSHANGAGDALVVYGSGQSTVVQGNTCNVWDYGNNDINSIAGTSNGLQVFGSSDASTVNGSLNTTWIQSTAVAPTTTIEGSGQKTVINGSGDAVSDQGADDTNWVIGNSDTLAESAGGVVSYVEGSHTLGLGSNADPTSVMFYQLTSQNRTLDATDLKGAALLYPRNGPGAATAPAADLGRLTQALASGVPGPVAGIAPAANDMEWNPGSHLTDARTYLGHLRGGARQLAY